MSPNRYPDFIAPRSLQNDLITMRLLTPADFESLFQAASDPLIWEQHPNRNRYQRPVFEMFFKGALESKSAYLVFDRHSGKVIGSSRFYDYKPAESTLCIGYTFLIRECWGKGYNHSLKSLMLEYAFGYVDSVIFHVGISNMRSRKAMEKLGGIHTGEMEMSYYGEPPHKNVVYRIDARTWPGQSVQNH